MVADALKRIVKHAGAATGFWLTCPCCGESSRRFESFGVIPRPNAQCPVCHSLERHRLMALYFRSRTDLFDGRPRRILHIAPERWLSDLLRSAPGADYLSADLFDPSAMVKMDIADIQYPDDTFDVIYCSHVLEHVPDDRKSMREFRRVLKPTGWAILQVPITADKTIEDPSVTDPGERLRLFGQEDHVRRYGPDYADRLREARLDLRVDDYARHLPASLIRRYSLMPNENIYFCRKG